MRKRWNEIAWKEAVPRIIADIAMVHLAALASLAAVVLCQMAGVNTNRVPQVIAELRGFYLHSFLPLSIVFPVVFLLSGFYTRSRSYATRYKWKALARGATLATLVFLLAAFLVSRADALPRSSILIFIALVNGMTVGARLLKSRLTPVEREQNSIVPAEVVENAGQRPVLVVGGGGYIGSILCRKLLGEGRRVRLLDNFVYGNAAVREIFGHPRFELHVGDCRNIQSVVSAMTGVDSLIHLAAVVGDPACEQDKRGALEINFAATRMMVEIAKGHGVQRFVFASSCSVYGETEEIVDERSAVTPISLYAQTKVDSERALLKARSDRFHPTILRLATVFGNSYRPRFDLVVNLLTARAMQEKRITIFNGEQWRPFIHVSDVADGMIGALRSPLTLASGEIYNLGDSRLNYTLSQVAATIQRLVPGTGVEHIENPDRRNYRVCFDKISRNLGFSCRMDLEEGILDLKSAIESKRIVDYTDTLYHNQRFLKTPGRLDSHDQIDAQVMAAFAVTLENYHHGLSLFK
ncbi:MAG TPA: SDR family oxidoreductase [Bryobacteraceae bacterium]|nr:SDR family oxidoreductase [Bryobacteraceae bacterium]